MMPILVKLILLITLFFLMTAFLLFLFILFSRLRDGIKQAQKTKMEQEVQLFITFFLFNEESYNKNYIKNFRRKHLSSKFHRDIVLASLIDLHKNLMGESSEKLRFLYVALGLKKYSQQQLNSTSWHKIAKGISEFAEMGSREDSKLIRPFINHQDSMLRAEAQVALLKLESDTPFSFLDELEEPLLEWQQMQLARAAQKADFIMLPEFNRWLHKKEESIVGFCIRMIAQYRQYNASQQLVDLLAPPYPSARVRREIIIAIRHMELYDTEDKLRQLYIYETVENQLEILKTLPVIAESDINSHEGVLANMTSPSHQHLPMVLSGKQQEGNTTRKEITIK